MTAVERVESSRVRLREALAPPPVVAESPTRARRSWLGALADLPLIGGVIESLGTRWSHHALRPVAQVAADAFKAALNRLVQRHPIALVLSASAVGAVLAWRRPRRWVFNSALLAGVLHHMVLRIVARLPVELWAAMLAAALQRPGTERAGRTFRSGTERHM